MGISGGFIVTKGYGGGNPVWHGYGGQFKFASTEVFFAFFANRVTWYIEFDNHLEYDIRYLNNLEYTIKYNMIDASVFVFYNTNHTIYFNMFEDICLNFNLLDDNPLEMLYNEFIVTSFRYSFEVLNLKLNSNIIPVSFDNESEVLKFTFSEVGIITSDRGNYKWLL